MVLRDLEGTQKAAAGRLGDFQMGIKGAKPTFPPQMPRGLKIAGHAGGFQFSYSRKWLFGDVLPDYISLDSQEFFWGFSLEFLLGGGGQILWFLVMNLLVLMRRGRYWS